MCASMCDVKWPVDDGCTERPKRTKEPKNSKRSQSKDVDIEERRKRGESKGESKGEPEVEAGSRHLLTAKMV